jgi:DNA adenine methylase
MGEAVLAKVQRRPPPIPAGGAPSGLNGERVKPPLKWAGGKRWLLRYLHPLWTHHRSRRLVEPLCGGLSVSLGLAPERALINDLNPHVINFYRWVKRGLVTTLRMRNDAKTYYSYRARLNELIATGDARSKEAAELFYYLNRTGYNGLCRFNRRGEFNVPFGRHHRINYVTDFSAYRPIFAAWDFADLDFEQVTVEPDDFIYADPPYDVDFTEYSKEGFGWEDQVRLAEWLAKHEGPVVLSNQATKRVIRLYSGLGFRLFFLRAPRMISCNGDRTPAQEILAVRRISL